MVSAVCIDWRTKQILLVLNTDPEKPLGFWGLPGGKMKEGEAVEIGALRELFQETNQEGKILGYRIEIPKAGSRGDYIHNFVAVRIIPDGRELKNYEDPAATPKWIPFQEIIAGRVKMFRGHIRGLMLVLEKMAEGKTADKERINKHGIKILSEGPPAVLEVLNEFKNSFSENGQFISYYRPRQF